MNIFHENCIEDSDIYIQENAFQNVNCKMAPIGSGLNIIEAEWRIYASIN